MPALTEARNPPDWIAATPVLGGGLQSGLSRAAEQAGEHRSGGEEYPGKRTTPALAI